MSCDKDFCRRYCNRAARRQCERKCDRTKCEGIQRYAIYSAARKITKALEEIYGGE